MNRVIAWIGVGLAVCAPFLTYCQRVAAEVSEAAVPAIGTAIEVKTEGAGSTPEPVSFQGVITDRETGSVVNFCFELSGEKEDHYAADPDLAGTWIYQDIPWMEEDFGPSPKKCASTWEHNGDFIRTCGRLYLTDVRKVLEPPSRGQVFTRLERFDPRTGRLKLEPVADYRLERVKSCRRDISKP